MHLTVIQNGKDKKLYNVSVKFDAIRKEDQGEIVFDAENKQGSDSSSVQLKVKGVSISINNIARKYTF